MHFAVLVDTASLTGLVSVSTTAVADAADDDLGQQTKINSLHLLACLFTFIDRSWIACRLRSRESPAMFLQDVIIKLQLTFSLPLSP